jgi:predicted NAD/FAD-binding protein
VTARSAAVARPSVAIVGSGVSGLTAAYLLTRTHDVTLFESDSRLGGHAHTHDVTASDGSTHAVDSGFIVHNDRTYPWLRKLFAELEVDVRPAEMSMSVRCDGCGVEYAGGRGVRGILAQPNRLFDPRFVRLMLQVKRFHRRAATFLRSTDHGDRTTYGTFLERERFSDYFITHYAVPVVSCVWSSGREAALLFPARYLFRVLDQHGMLRVTGSPQWYTVGGGSRRYVERVSARLQDVRTGRAVADITRRPDAVEIRDVNGHVALFDRVVIATHADQALNLLSDPTEDEVQTLKAFGYSSNQAVLHTDPSGLPRNAAARACWNYRISSCTSPTQTPEVAYWMNRLQGLASPDDYLVTLNASDPIDPARVVAVMDYEHPIYTPEALAAQSQLGALATSRTVYAGAYHGWGFHEDGCYSGVKAARHFGVYW